MSYHSWQKVKEDREVDFIEKIKEFIETDKEYYQLLNNHNNLDSRTRFLTLFNLAYKALDLKNLIELDLAQNDLLATIQVDDYEIREAIRKLREHDSFISIEGFENFVNALNELAQSSEDTISKEVNFARLYSDELFERFCSWFDVIDYYSSRLQVGPIVASQFIPKELIAYFAEIREAYAFGLKRSCISLCRALIELCLTNSLSRIENYQKRLTQTRNRNRGHQKDFSLYDKIEFAHEYHLIDERLKGKAHQIREKANEILHVMNSNHSSDQWSSVLNIIRMTVAIVEHLYK